MLLLKERQENRPTHRNISEIEQGENSSGDKSEIINYEINEIKETIEEQHGKVEDLQSP